LSLIFSCRDLFSRLIEIFMYFNNFSTLLQLWFSLLIFRAFLIFLIGIFIVWSIFLLLFFFLLLIYFYFGINIHIFCIWDRLNIFNFRFPDFKLILVLLISYHSCRLTLINFLNAKNNLTWDCVLSRNSNILFVFWTLLSFSN